jgi:hypothetical protein
VGPSRRPLPSCVVPIKRLHESSAQGTLVPCTPTIAPEPCLTEDPRIRRGPNLLLWWKAPRCHSLFSATGVVPLLERCHKSGLGATKVGFVRPELTLPLERASVGLELGLPPE